MILHAFHPIDGETEAQLCTRRSVGFGSGWWLHPFAQHCSLGLPACVRWFRGCWAKHWHRFCVQKALRNVHSYVHSGPSLSSEALCSPPLPYPVSLQSDEGAPFGLNASSPVSWPSRHSLMPGSCPSCLDMSLGGGEPQLWTTKEGPREARLPSPNFRKCSPSSRWGQPWLLSVLRLATSALGFMSQGPGLDVSPHWAILREPLSAKPRVFSTLGIEYGLWGCKTWESQVGESVWNGWSRGSTEGKHMRKCRLSSRGNSL